jgi:DNA-binding CsgD family transcriptional regulator
MASTDRSTREIRAPDLLNSEQWLEISAMLRLSAREAEMIRQACYDDNVAVMAKRMGLSQHTIHTYRERLYRKLGVRSFCQVVAVAFGAYVALREPGQASVPAACFENARTGDDKATPDEASAFEPSCRGNADSTLMPPSTDWSRVEVGPTLEVYNVDGKTSAAWMEQPGSRSGSTDS